RSPAVTDGARVPERSLPLRHAGVHGVGQAGQTGKIVIVLHRGDAFRRGDKVVAALLQSHGGFLRRILTLVQSRILPYRKPSDGLPAPEPLRPEAPRRVGDGRRGRGEQQERGDHRRLSKSPHYLPASRAHSPLMRAPTRFLQNADLHSSWLLW